MSVTDPFWESVRQCGTAVRAAGTVDSAISAFNNHFPLSDSGSGRVCRPPATAEIAVDSDADAFFAGSGGDDTVWEMLEDAGWKIIWSEADYFFVAQSPEGDCLTYIEGDIYRGDRRS
ncbi:hypothetical protein MUG78_17910 [Gordonia alkaliphila]|uniref:hypothetical protein n=1 Tax=Gordonia alkaliphila TaxID=1053547 RepID=UPI001FF25910|nr:hypothetical protein [Gordonia alkaliphila]MCK0441278.1 hypothetical protein [Gordonia alkaliphila]